MQIMFHISQQTSRSSALTGSILCLHDNAQLDTKRGKRPIVSFSGMSPLLVPYMILILILDKNNVKWPSDSFKVRMSLLLVPIPHRLFSLLFTPGSLHFWPTNIYSENWSPLILHLQAKMNKTKQKMEQWIFCLIALSTIQMTINRGSKSMFFITMVTITMDHGSLHIQSFIPTITGNILSDILANYVLQRCTAMLMQISRMEGPLSFEISIASRANLTAASVVPWHLKRYLLFWKI